MPIVKNAELIATNTTDAISRAKLVCDEYTQDKRSLESCCKKHGVDKSALFRWIQKFPEVLEMYVEAKRLKHSNYVVDLRERALTSMEKLVTGWESEEVTTTVIPERRTKDGKVTAKQRVKEVVTKTKQHGPNPGAVIFVLTNTIPDKFKRTDKMEGYRPPDEDGESVGVSEHSDVTLTLPDGTVLKL